MTSRPTGSRRFPLTTAGIAVAVTVLVVLGSLAGGPIVRVFALAGVAVMIGAYVAATHPLAIFGAFAAVLGFAPYVHLPGTDVPMLLVLSVGIWVALASVPGVDVRPGWCEMWVVALAAVALLSVVATQASADSLTEFVAWVAATATVIPIRHLPSAARTMTIQVFVSGAAAASAVGMLLLLDPRGIVARVLTFTGIDPDRPNVQVVAGSQMVSTRLNGTYFEANVAAFILAGAFLLALAYTTGRVRVLVAVVIGAGLLLTLSRTGLATVVIALVLLILRTGGRRRNRMALVGIAGIAAAVAVPAVRHRLLDSFGSTDTGTAARVKALRDFSSAMDGHWVWGLGWDRPEFRDSALAFKANIVANTPLATSYRGGVILGGLVVAVMIVLVVRSWRYASRGFGEAVVGCAIIGFVTVAMQLDYPAVTQPSATVLISMLIALSMPGNLSSGAGREGPRVDGNLSHR